MQFLQAWLFKSHLCIKYMGQLSAGDILPVSNNCLLKLLLTFPCWHGSIVLESRVGDGLVLVQNDNIDKTFHMNADYEQNMYKTLCNYSTLYCLQSSGSAGSGEHNYKPDQKKFKKFS